MCGIVGYLTSKNKIDYEKFFKQALVADTIRGMDSTGIIVGEPKGTTFYKKAVNGIDFLDMKPAEKMINAVPANRRVFMIGHNRAATVGNVVSANAHPFQHGSVVGVHNGTLRQFHRLEKSRDFGTDSEALYYNLSKRPLDETLSDVKGAYALVWYDSDEDSVNIIRNDERPLWIGKVKDEDTVLWASEAGMLRWLALRNGITLEAVMQPQPNVHLKFHMDADEVSSPEMIEQEVEDNYPIQHHVHQPRGGYGGSGSAVGITGTGATGSNNNSTTRLSKMDAARELEINFSDTYEVYCHKFEQYQTTATYGKAICYMTQEPYLPVELRAMTKEAANLIVKQQFKVQLSDVEMEPNKPWQAVTVGRRYEGNGSKKLEYIGPDSHLISLEDMREAVKDGCYFCQTDISIHEYDFTDFIEGKPICPDCIANNVSEELEA